MLCASVMIMSLGSCKSKQSAYKAAYESAKEQPAKSAYDEVEEAKVVTTPSAKPATSEIIQSEKVTVVDQSQAGYLKKYSVVVGSYLQGTNATARQKNFRDKGFDAILVKNEKGMYRVIVSSFDTKEAAQESRDLVKLKYDVNDAWILENQY